MWAEGGVRHVVEDLGLYAANREPHTVGFMVAEVNHSAHDHIEVGNARVNSLKNVSLRIPRNQVVVFTGVSGSGKSSLVFDTLHTEAQRQLIETFGSLCEQRKRSSCQHLVDLLLRPGR